MRAAFKTLARQTVKLTEGQLKIFAVLAKQEKAPQVAFINFTADHRQKDADACGLLAAEAAAVDMRHFVASGGAQWFPKDAGENASIYMPLPGQWFDAVIVGSSMRLFDNNWSYAFLANAAQAVKPGGKLVVWYSYAANSKGLLTQQALEKFFGSAASEKGNHHLVFTINSVPAVPPSVLSWYYSWFDQLLLREVGMRLSGNEDSRVLHSERSKGFCLNGDDFKLSSAPDYERRGDRYREETTLEIETKNAIERYAYYVGGISYKSELIGKLITHYCGKKTNLTHCDMGAGYGLLATELLINEKLRIARSIACDINSYNLLLAAEMNFGLTQHIRNRLKFWLGPSEKYPFNERYDVISFIGSMLYSPRGEVPAMLKRAYDALNPGGVLIVHENIKAPSYTTDYEAMFTVEELDALLEAVGPVERWSSQAHEPIGKEEAGSRTIFRVIKKV